MSARSVTDHSAVSSGLEVILIGFIPDERIPTAEMIRSGTSADAMEFLSVVPRSTRVIGETLNAATASTMATS
jgi:hypothetical protein